MFPLSTGATLKFVAIAEHQVSCCILFALNIHFARTDMAFLQLRRAVVASEVQPQPPPVCGPAIPFINYPVGVICISVIIFDGVSGVKQTT